MKRLAFTGFLLYTLGAVLIMILKWNNVEGNLEAQLILWVPMMYSICVTHFKVHQMHKDWKQKTNGSTSD